jgi:hypothetical protein
MARVAKFKKSEREAKGRKLHEPTECEYSVYQVDGKTVLQLDTLGSENRQEKGTPSQKLQLDEKAARDLLKILREAFPAIE